MSEKQITPKIKRADELSYDAVSKADGVNKAVIFDESDGATNFRMRRYQLSPDATVPKHTNSVEHEIHVLDGELVVGLMENETVVTSGDSVLIPDETVHWFRNETNQETAFLCMVPAEDASLQLVDE